MYVSSVLPRCTFSYWEGVITFTQHPPGIDGVSLTADYNAFVGDFAGKIDHIHLELDCGLFAQTWEGQGHLSGPVLWDMFWFVQFKDIQRILDKVRPISCMLDFCPSWLIKAM